MDFIQPFAPKESLTLQFMAFSIICYAILKPVIQFILSHFPTFIASPISPRRNTAEVPRKDAQRRDAAL